MLEPVLHRCDFFGFDGVSTYSLAEGVNKYSGALKPQLQQELTESKPSFWKWSAGMNLKCVFICTHTDMGENHRKEETIFCCEVKIPFTSMTDNPGLTIAITFVNTVNTLENLVTWVHKTSQRSVRCIHSVPVFHMNPSSPDIFTSIKKINVQIRTKWEQTRHWTGPKEKEIAGLIRFWWWFRPT